MGKEWTTNNVFGGVVFTGDPFSFPLTPVIQPGWTLLRILAWWNVSYFTPDNADTAVRTPNLWEFEVLAVENDTGEIPPPGPPDPLMRALLQATATPQESTRTTPSTDVFRVWHGDSGPNPVSSQGERAGVNYSGGAIVQVTVSPSWTGASPEGWYENTRFMPYWKFALLIQKPG